MNCTGHIYLLLITSNFYHGHSDRTPAWGSAYHGEIEGSTGHLVSLRKISSTSNTLKAIF